jgi:uncharacterized protein (TIRG00374 family)
VKPRARAALVWLGLAVTVLFGYLAVRNVNPGEAWDAFVESGKLWLLPALGALAVAVLVRVVRWRSLYAPSRRPPFRPATKSLLIGYLFNNLLPLRAGEAARVIALHRSAAASRVETAATIVVERAFDVLSLLLLLFFVLPWLPEVSWLRPAAALLIALGAVLLAAVVLLARFGERIVRLVLRPLSWLPFLSATRFEAGVAYLAEGLAGLRDPRVAVEAFAWTVLSWLLVALSFWFVLLGFDLDLSFLAALFVVIAVNLSLILPSSPGGLGVFEAAVVVALGAYGVSDSEALSYAILVHAVNSIPFIVVGAVVLQGERGIRDAFWRTRRGRPRTA